MTADAAPAEQRAPKRHKPDPTSQPLPTISPAAHFEPYYLTVPQPSQSEVHGEEAARSDQALEQFKKEGFLVVRGLLGPGVVESCKRRLQEILDRWQAGERPGQGDPGESPPDAPLRHLTHVTSWR